MSAFCIDRVPFPIPGASSLKISSVRKNLLPMPLIQPRLKIRCASDRVICVFDVDESAY